MERRLAAILAADVVGFSRQMGADEAATLARIAALRAEVLDPLLTEHRGRLFKTMGDGFLVDFSSAVQAVACAVAVQARLTEQPDGLRLRIGIHAGDVVVQGEDLMGDGVNIAARLEPLAEPGGIVISARVREDLTGKLTMAAEDMGEQALKNITQPIRAFRIRPAAMPAPATALPEKPAIAVLPFANMSGDSEQEYFVDGITNDIIAELSRFRQLLVIAASSIFTYKSKATDVRQVARELGVRYVLEGNARKAGNRVRVSAHLIDAASGSHLWAEHYDRTLDDIFAVQEDVTRGIVAAVAPEVELAEMARARRASPNDTAARLIWRAQGLWLDVGLKGNEAHILATIDTAEQAIAADPHSLTAHEVLARAHWICHLMRWGPAPENALDAAWSVVERMMRIDPLDYRTLTQCGIARVARGEPERGIAELRRALETNPNSALTMVFLAWFEASVGYGREAREHALLAIRLNPRDTRTGIAYLALAMVEFSARDYKQAVHWAELAIQSQPTAPIRRALMIACAAQAGDMARAARERTVLDGFAPHFIASLFRGENPVFKRAEDMAHLLDGLRLAGGAD